MAKQYLLLAAIPALLFASCANDNEPGDPNTSPNLSNSLKVNVLSSSSQAGRLSVARDTRGAKAQRLQYVGSLLPVNTAASERWSATSVTIANGKAYVTWHSDFQAHQAAKSWGGALDIVDIASIATNPDAALELTFSNDSLKLNQGYVSGNTLYLAGTSSKVGAAVGSIALPVTDQSAIRYLDIPGSSANSVYQLNDSELMAVSGYAGAAVKFPANFATVENLDDVNVTEVIPQSAAFGGKFVADGYILRSDDTAGEIIPVSGIGGVKLDAPLTSSEKYAESFNEATNQWEEVSGETATHYGKHTMAVKDGRAYVGAGKNGLRVYDVANGTALWSNGNYTAGVCVDDDYVYAASGNGLRVYTAAADGKLTLFAYEVEKYNETTGMAESSTAAANGHSANFVAVDPATGYIFVAYGQTGVRIYKLNAGAPEPPAPEFEYTLTYELSTASNQAAPNVSGMPDPQGSADGVFTLSGNVPTSEDSHWTFLGWSENPAVDPARNPNWESEVVKPGASYTATQKATVLYAIWQFNVSGGGNQGGGGSDVNPPSDPNQGGGGSDTGGGTFN